MSNIQKYFLKPMCFFFGALTFIPWIFTSFLFYITYLLYMLGWYGHDEKLLKENWNKFRWENRFLIMRAKNPFDAGLAERPKDEEN